MAMTIEKLIAKLSQFDKDMPVHFYRDDEDLSEEGGVYELERIEEIPDEPGNVQVMLREIF